MSKSRHDRAATPVIPPHLREAQRLAFLLKLAKAISNAPGSSDPCRVTIYREVRELLCDEQTGMVSKETLERKRFTFDLIIVLVRIRHQAAVGYLLQSAQPRKVLSNR